VVPPLTEVRLKDTCRLVPSRFPSEGILDAIAEPDDLDAILELEAWTNDRISAELGILHRLPPSEWVVGRPMASVIMAAFCHPRPEGGRFNPPDRGAWYAATSIEAAHAEVVYHRWRELQEVGVLEARLQMRLYRADFRADFHDVRPLVPENEPFHDPASYEASQALTRELLDIASNGVVYRSVRYAGGECLASFRPALVKNVRAAAHFEYRFAGSPTPVIRRL
jgi:hypothetical protein